MTSCHHHHLHQQPPPIPAAISSCTTCYCSTAPPSSSPDTHLLKSLISLLQSPQNPSPNSNCHCASNPKHQPQHQIRHKDRTFGKSQAVDSATQAVLESLVTRIDALESSLLRKQRESCMYGSSSVKEAAARVIQLHFRSYLVRRSRSLRHMKDLAFIKSRFNALKLSITDQARVDPVVFTRKTVDLLYKLDCIQDRDRLIVNGKKSLTRDLVGFLDYVDTIVVKRHGVVKQVSIVQSRGGRGKCNAFGGSNRDRRVVNVIETLRGQIDDEDEDAVFVSSSEEEIPYVSRRVINKKKYGTEDESLGDKHGARVRGKKNVSFADDGRNHNVEPKSKQNGDQIEILKSLGKRVEEMEAGLANGVQVDEDDESGSGDSSQTSDSEICGTSSAAGADHKTLHQHHPLDSEEFTFPTPSPNHVKMENRASSQT